MPKNHKLHTLLSTPYGNNPLNEEPLSKITSSCVRTTPKQKQGRWLAGTYIITLTLYKMDVNFDKGNMSILFYDILVQYSIYFLNARKEYSSYSPSNRSIWNNC
jgi:hypothetical protein